MRTRADPSIKRLEQMLLTVRGEVGTAIALLAALGTANQEIRRLGGRVDWYGGHCFAAIQTGLVTSLAMTLARLFDTTSDAATLPRLANLMGQARLELAHRASTWPIDGSEMVPKALKEISLALKASETKKAMKPLKEVRDARLAHALFEQTPTPPIYSDIAHLTDMATLVASRASVVITGANWTPFEVMEERRRQALAFWRPAIPAVVVSEGPHANLPSGLTADECRALATQFLEAADRLEGVRGV